MSSPALLRRLPLIRSMHRLTCDATLADLTSLEEMMRTMMEDDRISQDVINKLWQIFSELFSFFFAVHFRVLNYVSRR